MLVPILAIVLGVGSVTLYLAAFFFPEVHRKHDFFWSGVGFFYALVLWVDSGQIAGTELLGHIASIALVGWFGWQTLTLRRKRTPRDLQTPLSDQSWQVFGQDIAAVGSAWLQRTPLGRFLSSASGHKAGPVAPGEFRASALKQVDYEFLDELPPNLAADAQPKSPRSEAGASGGNTPPVAKYQSGARRSTSAVKPRTMEPKKIPPPRQSLTLLEKGRVLKDWLGELVTTATKPKSPKPVIVIPPRDIASSVTSDSEAALLGSPDTRSTTNDDPDDTHDTDNTAEGEAQNL